MQPGPSKPGTISQTAWHCSAIPTQKEGLMSFKKTLSAPNHYVSGDLALLLIRVVAGLAFALHGWPKIQKPMTWMGPDGFAPGIFQALAAVSEFGGGLAWILGFLTPIASLGIACTMAVAFYMHAFMRGDPFVSTGGSSYELAAIYFCIAVLLMAVGPGRFSVDRQVFGRR
jgi:putative oxidoreductase